MKNAELRELSITELGRKLDDFRKELLVLRIHWANQQLKNPLKLRLARRGVARGLTNIREKGEK